jgi:elongation factor 1 alpha-like protein
MSRHKMIKNLDLDEELDEYDGVDDYGYGYESEAAEAGAGSAEGACLLRFF